MKRLTCREVGIECDVIFEGETESDVMHQAEEHAASEHNLPEIPPILDKKIRKAIIDVPTPGEMK